MIELNADQQAVVNDRNGARSVIAGPGSGKTSTIVSFINGLINSGISASDIRAVTFSKEMAQGLEKRVRVKGIVSTFHSLGYLICSETERKPVEPELRYRLMCKLVRKWSLDYKELDAFIAQMRRMHVTPDEAVNGMNDFDYGLARGFADYENTRLNEGWMDFDCQPPDTQITMATGEKKRMVDVVVGDFVLSWNRRNQTSRKREISGISKHKYIGPLVGVRCAQKQTYTTPNHWFWAKFNERAKKQYAVYLMWKSGLGFRVGQCKFFSRGYSNWTTRMKHQNADKMWVLSVTENYYEALTRESELSVMYGLPQTVFTGMRGYPTPLAIERIFKAAISNNGLNCLADHGLRWDRPLIEKHEKMQQWTRKEGGFIKVAACNLIPEIMSVPADGEITEITRKNYEGYVYGLSVDTDHTYVADGLVTGNSMLADAIQMLERPDVRRRWQPRYLIVDEAQDTDDLQWRMMQLMSEKHGNITVVGDPNQCQPAGTLVRTAAGAMPIECLETGDHILSWTKEDQRIYIRSPRKITAAKRFYRGDMLTIHSGESHTQMTPNHYVWTRFTSKAFEQKPHFVYLMWRPDLGFRVGTSQVRRNRSGGCFLTMRARQEKAEKMWILQFCASKQEAEIWEEMTSLRYRIPECMFHPYAGIKKTTEQIAMIFECADPNGGYQCLRDHHLLFSDPIFSKEKAHNFRGYFKTVAANLVPHLMLLPTEEINGSAPVWRIDREPFCGTVYSLDVEKDHTYVADGIPVGNCIYSFRGAKPDNITNFQQWFPNGKIFYLGRNYRSTKSIVKFVRENTPADTPKELLDRMIAARTAQGAAIGLKMYWTDDGEAESALKLSQRDPLNSIILARTNHTIGLLERLCNQYKLRYHLLGKSGLWKQNEVRRAVEALKSYPTLSSKSAFDLILPTLESKYAVEDRTERDNDALANLQTLRLIGKDFATAREFMVYANKMMHRKNDPRGVSISTVHQAKGGEWKNVFLIGVNAKGFPHPKGDPKEEERIYFVALSRAIDMLRISFSGTPSPYLRKYLTDEILDKLRESATEVDRLQEQHQHFV